MPTQYISIQDATALSQKSAQTIRRLIKINKIKCKKQRTPQGFNYLIEKKSFEKYFGVEISEIEPIRKGVSKISAQKANEKSTLKAKPSSANDTFSIPLEEADIPFESIKAQIMSHMEPRYQNEQVREGITIEAVENYKVYSGQKGFTSNETKSEVVGNRNEQQDNTQFALVLKQMLDLHQEEKERLYSLIEQFQKRTIVLEERVKRLEAPMQDRPVDPWWRFW